MISPQRRRVLLYGMAGLLAGCSSTASRIPHPYAIELAADAQVNPDVRGRPSPVQITVYELRAAHAFQAASYFALTDNPTATLGEALIDTEQVMLQPGQTHVITRAGSLQGRMIGIIAGYRDLDATVWRTVIALPEAQHTNIYKVWQFSPGEEAMRIELGARGMKQVAQDSGWW